MAGNAKVTAEQGVRDAPDRADVERALERVLASEMFRGSAKLGAFLRYVVEATLRGEQDRIKGYTIGVEALGREESFDPQIDPIVRVEATRLRRTLERYYAGPGAGDRIVFELSRGSYVPAIRARAADRDAAATPPDPARRAAKSWDRRTVVAVVAGIVVIIAGVVALSRHFARQDSAVVPGREVSNQSLAGALQPGNGMPTLAIPRISILALPPAPGAQRPLLSSAGTLTEKLRAAIARFDTLNVAGEQADDSGAASSPAPVKPEAIADYQLLGSGEFHEDGSASGRFRLLDVATGTVIWSRTFGPLGPAADYGPLEDSVVRQLAITLAPPYGVIRANERLKHLAGGARDPRYRCILEASESFRSFDPAQHVRARTCLEALTARDPGYAMGFAYLAAVYTREFQYGLSAAQSDPQLLDRALRSARQGVELSPESARAYQMLFTVLFARRDMPAAFAAGDKAIALNSLDMTILSDYGGRLIMTGEVERGMEALRRAADDGAVRPSWYHFYLFLGAYLSNDLENATRNANQITGDGQPLGLLARTLAAAANGNRELARASYDQLILASPAWGKRPKDELNRLFPPSPVGERVMRDLISAGLVPAG
jgi:hypothetical protein